MYDDEISKLSSLQAANAMSDNNAFLDPETGVEEISNLVDPI